MAQGLILALVAQIAATRTPRPPDIDGRLDDAVWHLAPAETRFRQSFPDQAAEPSQPVELRILYDDRALYVGIRCRDDEAGSIVEQLTRRDTETDADRVTVDIDSRDDRISAYHFGVNVSGVLTDGVRLNDTEYDAAWDGVWDGAAQRDARGWSAELAIPWRSLRFEGRTPVMGLQVRRYLPRRQEVDEWAYIPRTDDAEVSRYGRMTIAGVGPARLVQLAPYALVRGQRTLTPGTSADLSARANVGADFKLGLTSSLTLDATLNPDFGQVVADQNHLNLSTLELAYAEKRPFFLEGFDLFGTPIRQLYTRRIGRAPPAVVASPDERVVSVPEVGRVWAAGRLTGPLAPHLQIVALEALGAERTSSTVRDDGSRADRLVDPLSSFSVLRLRADADSSWLGVTATAVNRFEPPHAAAPRSGDLCPDDAPPSPSGRCSADGYSGGVDTRLATADATWEATAHGVVSHVEGGTTRALPDGTARRPGDTGFGVQAGGGKRSGEHLLGGIDYQGYSPRFDLDAAGYVQQANLHRIAANLTLRSTRPIGPTLESDLDLFTIHRLSWQGVRLYDSAGLGAWTRLESFWQLGANVGWNFTAYDNRETRDGALVERVGGWFADALVRSDPRARLLGELELEAGRRLDGAYVGGYAGVTARPWAQIALELSPRWALTWGDPRWYATDDLGGGTRRYHFGELTSGSLDATLRASWTLTPRLSLQAYGQVFLTFGRFAHFRGVDASGPRPTLALAELSPEPGAAPDFRDGSIDGSLVLRWEFGPGSTLFVVYARTLAQAPYTVGEGPGRLSFGTFGGGAATDALLVKLSYLWQP